MVDGELEKYKWDMIRLADSVQDLLSNFDPNAETLVGKEAVARLQKVGRPYIKLEKLQPGEDDPRD